MVTSIAEDSNGVLWFSTLTEGLTEYDKTTNTFTHHRVGTASSQIGHQAFPFTPRHLLVDRQNVLWAGTDGGGLYSFDSATRQWQLRSPRVEAVEGRPALHITSIAAGPKGVIWFGTQQQGLFSLDPATDVLHQYSQETHASRGPNDNWINAVLVGPLGRIWCGTQRAGIAILDPDSETFIQLESLDSDSTTLGSNEVWSLTYQAALNVIWVSHLNGEAGLSAVDPESLQVLRYPHIPSASDSPSSNSVTGTYISRDEILWVINFNGVIDTLDPRRNRFSNSHLGQNPTASEPVATIFEDSRGDIWLGGTEGTLQKQSADGTIETIYSHGDARNSGLPPGVVYAICEDRTGRMWLGSWQGVLSEFDPSAGRVLRSFSPDDGTGHGMVACRSLKCIVEDKEVDGVFWIGTVDGGLMRFDSHREQFTSFVVSDNSTEFGLRNNTIPMILDEGDGKLWIPTYGGGLHRFDKSSGAFTVMDHDASQRASINSDTLYQVHRDRKGTLWISGKGGISRLREDGLTFQNFGIPTGFPSNVISSIQEDEKGILWLATVDAGLIRFDPETGKHHSFTARDGLPGDSYFWNTSIQDSKGRLWFGGAQGATSFYPADIRLNDMPPATVLTALSQGGQDLVTDRTPETLQYLKLQWPHNYFSFQFSALNFTRPEKNRYQYYLDGRDQGWIDAGKNPAGHYSGLAGGTYVLHLRGSNNDGIWDPVGRTLTIEVIPPFWKSTIFHLSLIVLALLLLCVVAYYIRRLRSEIRQRVQTEMKLAQHRDNLESEVAARTRALEETRDALIHHEQMALLGKLTTMISHELRTPLGTIRASIFSLRRQVSAENPGGAKTLERADRSIQRCDRIIEELANIGREVDIVRETIDLNPWLTRIVTEFDFPDWVTLDVRLGADTNVTLDPEALALSLDHVLQNAVEALKERREREEETPVTKPDLVVRLRSQILAQDFQVIVEDNGVGLADDVATDTLFEPLYSTKSYGAGLGLTVVSRIIACHRGSVQMSTADDSFTKLLIRLPLTAQGDRQKISHL